MLYSGQFGETLVSDQFNALCILARVEAQIQPFPNPGDPSKSARMIRFRNFNTDKAVKVTQLKQTHMIPANGELTIMLRADEDLPNLEVEQEGDA